MAILVSFRASFHSRSRIDDDSTPLVLLRSPFSYPLLALSSLILPFLFCLSLSLPFSDLLFNYAFRETPLGSNLSVIRPSTQIKVSSVDLPRCVPLTPFPLVLLLVPIERKGRSRIRVSWGSVLHAERRRDDQE